MINFSNAWKSSKNPGKQRKYRAQAPMHIKRKMMGCHLAKPLREKHKTRTMPVRKEDTVSIVRGQYRKKSGKVERVDAKNGLVYITGIDVTKKDGSKLLVGFSPSNLVITALHLEDKTRVKSLERKQ